MKKILILPVFSLLCIQPVVAQNVGIGTTTPNANALLHVELSNSTSRGLLISGIYDPTSIVPDLGAGSRFMFYPGKVAFRVGYTNATQWDNSNVGQFSAAMGYGTTASGYVSTAFGRFTIANNSYATAMGYGSIASGNISTAMGQFTTASGNYSTATGRNTIASGGASTAMGFATKASGDSSTAMGFFTTASGNYSTAMGWNSSATGTASTATGSACTAGGTNSFAMGYFNKAKGAASTVIGVFNDSLLLADQDLVSSTTPLFIIGNGDSNNDRSNALSVLKNGNVRIGKSNFSASALLHVAVEAGSSKGFLVTGENDYSPVPDLGQGSRLMFYPGKAALRAGFAGPTNWNNVNVGDFSVAMGFANTASGKYSFATGNNTLASGEGSFASGEFTKAIGQSSTAMGRIAYAIGASSTAMGSSTTARGWYSTAMGYSNIAKGYASTVIGMNNDSLLIGDQNNVTNTTPLFIIGNGDFDNRSNAMVVLKNGYVGIGDNTPTNPLSFPPVLGKKISLYPGGTGDAGFAVQGNQLLIYSDNANASVKLGYDQAGVFTNNLTVYGNGDAWLRGTLTQNSDVRLKKDVGHIANALPLLMQLSGYQYHWKNEKMDTSLQSGVLAQEVQKVFPQLVKEDAEGTLSVNYNGLIPYMIEAFKDQQKQIEELKTQNKKLLALEVKMKALENIIAQLNKLPAAKH